MSSSSMEINWYFVPLPVDHWVEDFNVGRISLENTEDFEDIREEEDKRSLADKSTTVKRFLIKTKVKKKRWLKKLI